MNPPKRLAAALAAGTLMLTLAACGEDGDAEPSASQTASNGDVYNDADVDFATTMIPHHAQALVMVDMTRGRDLSPEVQDLTEAILAAQGPEIEMMVDWLEAWDKPVPETMRDHVNAEHGDDGHDMDHSESDMPGMMTDEEMDELEAARGADFEDMWLEMMIRHHEGAIDMAEEEQEAGTFGSAIKLAKAIESAQRAEIERMEKLAGS